MEFGIIVLVIGVGYVLHRLTFKPKPPFEEAMLALQEGKTIRAEHVLERALKKVVSKHGEGSTEAARSSNELARIVLFAGEPSRARTILEPALAHLREKGTAEDVAFGVCTRAMIISAVDEDTPAFVDLDDLTEPQLKALVHGIAQTAPNAPPVLAAPLLAYGTAFLEARLDDAALEPLHAARAELVRQAEMAAAMQLQAAQAAEGCGEESCGSGGCGSGPKGEVDPEFSRRFNQVLMSALPEGMVAGVEMRREGDQLTPRVQVARPLSSEEEKVLKGAIADTMKVLAAERRDAAPMTLHGAEPAQA